MKKILTTIALFSTIVSAEYFYTIKYEFNIGNITEQAQNLNLSNISCGNNHCYALKDGVVWAVGYNAQGQLGLYDFIDREQWTRTNFTADYVVAGSRSGYALKNGLLWVIGYNFHGQLGLGHRNNVIKWTNTNFAVDNIFVTNNSPHAYALKDGTIWSVGWNNSGRLGVGHTTDISVWTNTNTQADYVVAGRTNGYALKDGRIWSVGNNTFGQLGLGDTTQRNVWTNTNFTADYVVAGIENAYALKDGVVWAVGRNQVGQLGLGDTINRNQWTNTNFTADYIFTADGIGYALKEGTLWTVSSSQWINTNFTADAFIPGYLYSYVLRNGVLWSRGNNSSGQLGLGDTINKNEWTEITEYSNEVPPPIIVDNPIERTNVQSTGQILASDGGIDWYGEVSSANFINGSQLSTLLGLTRAPVYDGYLINSNIGWLHVGIDGKELFIAKRPLRHSISWKILSDANLIYGNRIVNINGQNYKIRRMSCSLSDPNLGGAITHSAYDINLLKDTEWNRIMYRLTDENYRLIANHKFTEGFYRNLAYYSETDLTLHRDLGQGANNWCQEKSFANNRLRIITKGGQGVSYHWVTTDTAAGENIGWRPVLEKVN